MLTMLLGGLWHGAAWNFVAWGAWHGGLLAIHRFVFGRSGLPLPDSPRLRIAWAVIGWSSTIAAVLFSWLLFRARSMSQTKYLRSPKRDSSALAYDSDRDVFVLYGGNGSSCGGNCNETWEYYPYP